MSKEEQGSQPPSDLVLKLGEALLAEPKLEKIEWDTLGLLLDFREGFIQNYEGFTYLYKPKDYIRNETDYSYEIRPEISYGYRPFAPDTDAVTDSSEELYEVMKSKGDRIWHRALVHLVAETGAFNIHLEYDDPTRWDINDENITIGDFIDELRPK